MRGDVFRRVEELRRAGVPFALATVVRVERPASTHPGDRAVITSDGTLDGWIGGACSGPVVVREALRAIADGTPRLVRIGPEDMAPPAGVVSARTTCPSEGTIEVFVDPVRPGLHLVIFGASVVAETLARLAAAVGYRTSVVVATAERAANADAVYTGRLPRQAVAPEDAAVVATMGHWDEDALAQALHTTAHYVGLVASRRRARAVLSTLRERGFGEGELQRVHSPAGIDLGSASQEEIALAVMAEVVAERHRIAPLSSDVNRVGSQPPAGPAEAVDPVCGMTVAIPGAQYTSEHDGRTYYFCNPSCKHRFDTDPARYVPVGSG